ncbi:hypothetical protein EMIT0196MI5_130119 [Pseudomonas sp. IT-196MI5]
MQSRSQPIFSEKHFGQILLARVRLGLRQPERWFGVEFCLRHQSGRGPDVSRQIFTKSASGYVSRFRSTLSN